MLFEIDKKPRILRRLHKEVKAPEVVAKPVILETPPVRTRHWWEDEEIEEVPWAKSLEYLKFELKLKSFGQSTSIVYYHPYSGW